MTIFKERDKRRHIAHSYYTDSGQLLYRAKECLADPLSKRFSYRGKIASDLVMSIECSLKSLLATHALDTENAKPLFFRIFGFRHDLKKMSKNLKSSGVQLPGNLDAEIKPISALNISLRYALESFSDMASQKPVPDKYNFTNEDGMLRLLGVATQLSKFAQSESKKKFTELNAMKNSELLGFFEELASIPRKNR